MKSSCHSKCLSRDHQYEPTFRSPKNCAISTQAADHDQGEYSNTGDTNSPGQDSRANKILVNCCQGVITSQSLFYLSLVVFLKLGKNLRRNLISFKINSPTGARKKGKDWHVCWNSLSLLSLLNLKLHISFMSTLQGRNVFGWKPFSITETWAGWKTADRAKTRRGTKGLVHRHLLCAERIHNVLHLILFPTRQY